MAESQSQCEVEVVRLIKKYELSESSCNKMITDVHLDKISRRCSFGGGARKSLAIHLGLGKNIAEDINRGPGNEWEKRSALFDEWIRIKGSEATYTRLVTALLTIQHKQDAEEVLRLLQRSITSPLPSPTVIPPISSGNDIVHGLP